VSASQPLSIDPRAIISPKAELAEGVTVGPFTVIEDGVKIGKGTWIGPHAVIKGPTTIGEGNKIFQFASIGHSWWEWKRRVEKSRPLRATISGRAPSVSASGLA